MISRFRDGRKALEAGWVRSGDTGAVLAGECRLVDSYIKETFERAGLQDCLESVCLIALGGYGREEFFPFSDIDLMILYRPEIKARIKEVTDGVLYPLWDTGLEVGHGVRTVEESMEHAGEDYFFLVALLDSRRLLGSEKLFAELLETFNRMYVDGQREAFVEKMKEFRLSRRNRFGSHGYLLEPHIKEGRGGMRDIQAMLWTARVVFGLKSPEDIRDAGMLQEDEAKEFMAARDLLFRLRCHLHFTSRRKSDQLYFEQQDDMAKAFGYSNRRGVRGVEWFMQDVYGALQTVRLVTDLFFDHVDEVLGLAGKERMIADRVVEKGIEIRRGRIHLTLTREQLEAKPLVLIRIFLAMARTSLPMHHRTRKTVLAWVDLITEKERSSARLAKTFFAAILEAQDILLVLETMLETGVLSACIPEFLGITSLAQHDLYHIYTVDRHSLQTVAELSSLLSSWEAVSQHVRDRKVLFLAAILHDIGKGRGKDHSIEGARIASRIGQRLCLSDRECDHLSFLVRYHLFIPENALRRDLNDVVFIKRCAETIGDVNRLSMLYLLSVADSRATGPSAWSDWKATLMEEMYLKVYPYLDIGWSAESDVTAHEEQGVEWLREQLRLRLKGEEGLMIDPDCLSTDYVLSFSPEDIVEHILTQRDHYQRIRQRSLVVAKEEEEGFSLLVMAVDRPGLLAKICGVMALNNLSVTKAQIFTWADNTVVDVIDVRSTDGLSFAEKDWQGLNEQLDLAIAHRMGLSHRLYSKLASVYGRKKQPVGNVASKVIIDNKSSDAFTVIEVYAADIPSQLYHITQAMADFGLNIHKAYIATEVEQLIDAFYVLDSSGCKITDEPFKEEVTRGILHSIGRVDN
jgi:[protein-PII] uridylyltransferase